MSGKANNGVWGFVAGVVLTSMFWNAQGNRASSSTASAAYTPPSVSAVKPATPPIFADTTTKAPAKAATKVPELPPVETSDEAVGDIDFAEVDAPVGNSQVETANAAVPVAAPPRFAHPGQSVSATGARPPVRTTLAAPRPTDSTTPRYGYAPPARTYTPPAYTPPPSYSYSGGGSGYGAISTETGRPRTVAVRGYTRRDGTYVRPHYRSRPRR